MAGLNLFVANLSPDVDDELFRATFSAIGPIVSSKVMLDIHTGISRGFGFVLFQNEDDGMRALVELQGKPLGRRDNPMVITKAQTGGYNAVASTPKIHLRNVPLGVPEAELHTLLSTCGTVERIVVKEDRNEAPPESRNWVPPSLCIFVQFSKASEAEAAVTKLHNTKPWPNMVVPLMAKPAETPEMRMERKARQNARKGDPRRAALSQSPGCGPVGLAPPPVPGPHATGISGMPQQHFVLVPPRLQQPSQLNVRPAAPAQHSFGDSSTESYSLTSSFGSSWNFSQQPLFFPHQLPPGMHPQGLFPQQPPQHQGLHGMMAPVPQFMPSAPLVPMMYAPELQFRPVQQLAPQIVVAPMTGDVGRAKQGNGASSPLVPALCPPIPTQTIQHMTTQFEPFHPPLQPQPQSTAHFEQSLESLSGSVHSPHSSSAVLLNPAHHAPDKTHPQQYVVVLDPRRM